MLLHPSVLSDLFFAELRLSDAVKGLIGVFIVEFRKTTNIGNTVSKALGWLNLAIDPWVAEAIQCSYKNTVSNKCRLPKYPEKNHAHPSPIETIHPEAHNPPTKNSLTQRKLPSAAAGALR